MTWKSVLDNINIDETSGHYGGKKIKKEMKHFRYTCYHSVIASPNVLWKESNNMKGRMKKEGGGKRREEVKEIIARKKETRQSV